MKKAVFFSIMILIVLADGFAEQEVQELAMIARKWEFFPSTITVLKDIPVTLFITSIDVTHGFGIRDFDVSREIDGEKMDGGPVKLQKGRITTVSFIPNETGEFIFNCTVFCGSGHRTMKGVINVLDQPSENTL